MNQDLGFELSKRLSLGIGGGAIEQKIGGQQR
jgi:hypothetical protein